MVVNFLIWQVDYIYLEISLAGKENFPNLVMNSRLTKANLAEVWGDGVVLMPWFAVVVRTKMFKMEALILKQNMVLF